VYVSWRYFDPVDTVVRLFAAFGAAEIVTAFAAVVALIARRAATARDDTLRATAAERLALRPAPGPDGPMASGPLPQVDPVGGGRPAVVGASAAGEEGAAARRSVAGPYVDLDGALGEEFEEDEELGEVPDEGPLGQPSAPDEDEPEEPVVERAPVGPGWRRTGLTVGVLVAMAMAVAAVWPAGPFDPVLDSTLDRDTRLSANAATAIDALRPITADDRPITVSGPQRARVALELNRPLVEVRDLFVAGLSSPADGAVAGTDAVFHDADGDRPTARFAGLSRTTSGKFGIVVLDPILVEPERGLYVLQVRTKADPEPPVGGDIR
jgi:hypothetical protein